MIIDYRTTYVYVIGNGHAPPIVLHWAALKHSPVYLVLTKINWKVTFEAVCWVCVRTVELFTEKTRVTGVLERSFILSEASIVCQTKSQELTVWFCSSKWLAQGKLEFLSPSTEGYLQLATLWMSSDYLYLVEVLHKHLLNLWTSLTTILQGQTTWKDSSKTLAKNVKFCLLLLPIVATLRTFLSHEC